MGRIASIFLLQRLKGSMPGDARDFNNMENRPVIKYFFFPCKARRRNEIYAIMIETLGEYVPSYATVKIWWPSLNVVIFSPVMRLVLDDPRQ